MTVNASSVKCSKTSTITTNFVSEIARHSYDTKALARAVCVKARGHFITQTDSVMRGSSRTICVMVTGF